MSFFFLNKGIHSIHECFNPMTQSPLESPMSSCWVWDLIQIAGWRDTNCLSEATAKETCWIEVLKTRGQHRQGVHTVRVDLRRITAPKGKGLPPQCSVHVKLSEAGAAVAELQDMCLACRRPEFNPQGWRKE